VWGSVCGTKPQHSNCKVSSTRVQTRPKPSDFSDVKILSMPSFGGEVNLSHVPTLGHVKDPSCCSSLRAAGEIRMFSFLPSLIEASRAAWCGVPLEMKEGTIPIMGTKGLSTRPRCITLITQLKVSSMFLVSCKEACQPSQIKHSLIIFAFLHFIHWCWTYLYG
jgi:hypothetical protein